MNQQHTPNGAQHLEDTGPPRRRRRVIGLATLGALSAGLVLAAGMSGASATPTAAGSQSVANTTSTAPTNNCQAWRYDEPIWPLGEHYKIRANCTSIADFTQARGSTSYAPLHTKAPTPWFTQTNQIVQSEEWTMLPEFTDPPAHMEYQAAGEGVKVYTPDHAPADSPIVLEATVRPDASGTVTFTEGDRVLGTATTSNGVGTLTLPESTLGVGNHQIVASYTYRNGNAYDASTTMTVTRATPALHIGSSWDTNIPLPSGDPVTLTLDLPDDATGQVTFRDSASPSPDFGIGTVPVVNGKAQLTTGWLQKLGNHHIDAFYSGDGRYLHSESGRISFWVVENPRI